LVCPLLAVCAAPGPGALRKRATAERFEGSSRFFRGRVLDALRALPNGDAVSVNQLAADVGCMEGKLVPLLKRMLREGLVTRDDDGGLRLPS
jgi:predicted transcriptional regulator